jgi:hypothetical protein
MDKRFLTLVRFAMGTLGMIFEPLKELMTYAKQGDYYSHIAHIPLVDAYLFFQRERLCIAYNDKFRGMVCVFYSP